jgi:ligand-binding SRPBCC domain-containing protein
MKIEYRVRPLFNIPMGWTTEIKKVSAPFRFTDKQIKGPYALWEHTHTFEQVPGGVKMTDEVDYALPFGWLGIFAHALIVKNKLKDIFNFREQTLTKFFGEYKKP